MRDRSDFLTFALFLFTLAPYFTKNTVQGES